MDVINVIDVLRIKQSILKYIDDEIINHGMETAYITYMIGKKLGYNKDKIEKLVIVSILHDIGAYKTEELSKIKKFEFMGENSHSSYGYAVLKQYRSFEDLSSAVLYHHHSYLDKDRYISSIPIPEEAFLINLADRISIMCNLYKFDEEKIYKHLYRMRKETFSPNHIKALDSVLKEKEMIKNLIDKSYEKHLIQMISNIKIDRDSIKEYLILLPISIDMYSGQTAIHTVSVASAAKFIANKIGLDRDYIEKIEIGAYLHDIGKVCTSKSILEKEGQLTDNEFKNMKNHVAYSKQILEHAKINREVIDLACNHHEKLDGSGYSQGLLEKDLSIGDKIVAISDIYCALIEIRHYKEAFTKEKVIGILKKMVEDNKIDKSIVNIACDHYEELYECINRDNEVYKRVLDNITYDYNDVLQKINNIGIM